MVGHRVRKFWSGRVWITPAALISLLFLPGALSSQLISIRTVPVSQAHQFDFLPSQALAMGGVGIAVADSLLDPFVNPAKGARRTASTFFSSPGLYSVSSGAGAGRSLPFGAVLTNGSWFGGLALALQQVDPSDQNVFFGGGIFSCPTCGLVGINPDQARRPRGNEYALASIGRRLPGDWSLGASASWSGLDRVDGTDLLYAGSTQIDQLGGTWDFRLGLLKEWSEAESLELVGLYNRYRMTHDVFYLDVFWDPDIQQVSQRPRLERNLDRTNTWGLHVEYERPLASEEWSVGWVGTLNYKAHPKIPNYEIQNIPRDPGFSWAYNAGIGIGRTSGSTTLGVDLVYEPIWSHTWADLEDPIETVAGNIIPPGGMTIENRFRFHNAHLRLGVSDEVVLPGSGTAFGVSFGLSVSSIQYHLDQTDHVQLTSRELDEQWLEWAPTWGVNLRRPGFEFRYRGLMTHGTGRPGVEGFPRCFDICLEDVAGRAGTNIIAAPSGPLILDPVKVTVHQVSISVPLKLGALRGTGREEEDNR